MGIPAKTSQEKTSQAKTLVKVKQESYQDFCEFCNQNEISVSQSKSDCSSTAIYVSLDLSKRQILNFAEEIDPFVIGNLAGC